MRRVSSASRKQRLAAVLLFLITPVTSWGLDSDRSQPIHIEADRATIDEQGNKSIYDGNVRLRQGTFQLQGDQMTILLANKQLEKVIMTGKPATLRQRLDGKDADQHAEADNIEYSAGDERVILLGNAHIWQAGKEEFRSERIVFNLKDKTVNAGGNNSRNRVHITLQPENRPDKKQ